MDQLVKMVSDKTGISESQAQQAVNVVLGFLKERLPEPVASQLDAVAGGKKLDSLGDLGDLGGQLGGLLGKK
jgi:hypothetical protein